MNALQEKAQGLTYAQSEIDDILVETYKSTETFAQLFFPERCSTPFSDSHKEFFAAIDDPSIQLINLIAHRGWGKSTIGNLILPAKILAFRDTNFLLQLANTSAQAERDSEDLKTELVTNEFLTAVFGSIKPETKESQFSKEAWKTPVKRNTDGRIEHLGSLVMPRGWGQQVRGLKNGRFRPDWIICDDIEGTEGAMSDEQRVKLKDWIYADLLNVVQRSDKLTPGEHRYRVLFIGTLLHQDSLLANLAENTDWHTINAPLCKAVDDGNRVVSLWTDFKSDEGVELLYEAHRKDDELDVFYREYMCDPVPFGKGDFKKDYFKYYIEDQVTGLGLESVVIVDPSKVAEARNADTAIVGWSLNASAGNLYVRDIVSGKIFQDDMYREAAEMAKRIGAEAIGVESTGLGSYIMQPFKDFLSRWGYRFELIELKSPGVKNAKDDRIKSLLPYYRQGRVYHNQTCCRVLESQLMAGKYSKKKDVADAAAYVVEMLHLGDRNFLPESKRTEKGEVVDQYDEIEYEPAFHVNEPSFMTQWDIQHKPRVSSRMHNSALPIFPQR